MSLLKINLIEGDFPSLHPHQLIAPMRGRCASKLLFECLTRINSKGKAELAGAKSVDISSDRLHYTFSLRDHLWSNGQPVTAQHYENAWKEALSPTSNCERAHLLYMIKNAQKAKKGLVSLNEIGVKAIDEKTLVVELDYPFPEFLEIISQIIAAPLIDPKKKEPTEFNGPFVVNHWKKNDRLQLKPNPHFWNKDKISLKQIDFLMVRDIHTALALYEKGEINWIGSPLSPMTTEMIEFNKNSLKLHPVDRFFSLYLNTKHSALASPSIRKALSMVIDRQLVTNYILTDFAPAISYLSENRSSPTSDLNGNLALAQKLFEKGLNELNCTRENFPLLEISYLHAYPNFQQVAQYLQETWSKAFGIQVSLRSKEWGSFRSNLEKGLFEISCCAEATFYPMEFFERLTTLDSANFSKWSNPLFNEKVSLTKQEKKSAHRQKLFEEVESIFMEETPSILIGRDKIVYTHHPKLNGYIFDCTGAVDFSYACF